jgi:hypothetical protein
MKNPSLQNHSLIHNFAKKAKQENGLTSEAMGFYFVLLATLFDVQDDEIENSITDNAYWTAKGHSPTRDRGVDLIYINEQSDPPIIHLLTCKYTSVFTKSRSFFPGNEVDKLLTFVADLNARKSHLLQKVTAALRARVLEIWNLVQKTNPTFVVHVCSNYTEGLVEVEADRLRDSLKSYSGFSYSTQTQYSLATLLAGRGRSRVDTKLTAVHRNLFEKSGGDVRALIVHVEGEQLIRALSADEKVRSDVTADRSLILGKPMCDDAFDDNVRVYLEQRSKVNRSIKATILSSENSRFFYFNNGITMTCDRFKYPTGQSSPLVEIENVQVVNGGQTLHALHEAYNENPAKIEAVDLLCRIYETTSAELSSKIAEHTNTQTPVKTRDIRSIDIVQIKLEQEFFALGLFYERKKNQHSKQPKLKRIDAEKCGQVALAFYLDLPLQAKNKKQLIFGEKYEELFSDDTTANKLLLPLRLFDQIEEAKAAAIKVRDSWLRYASYHILYALKLSAVVRKVALEYSNIDDVWKLFAKAKRTVGIARKKSRKQMGPAFEDVLFFKSGDAKHLIHEQFP